MSGRHRAPSPSLAEQTGPLIARTAIIGLLSSPFAMLATANASPASAGVLDDIEQCESGGDPNAQNPSSTASGRFQFLDGTWRSVGGRGSASDASPAEQRRRAEILLAREGTTPWNASKSCWQGKGGARNASVSSGDTARDGGDRRRAQGDGDRRRSPSSSSVTGRAADGSGTGRCTTDKLYFEACDPANLGDTFQYPKYVGKHRR